MAKDDLFKKNPLSLPSAIDDALKHRGTPLPDPNALPRPAASSSGPAPAKVAPKAVALLDGQKVEASVQMRSTRTVYDLLSVTGDPSKSRSMEININTASWSGANPGIVNGYPGLEYSPMCSPALIPITGPGPALIYAIIEFGTETTKRRITVDCSKGANVVVPASSVKVSVFADVNGAAGPAVIPAGSEQLGWINASVSYADSDSNKHAPKLTIYPIPCGVTPALPAGLLAGASVVIPIPEYAGRVQVFAKAGDLNVMGTPGGYYVSGYNNSAVPGNGWLFTVYHNLLGNPPWIELGGDTHRLVLTADLVNIFVARAIFELDI